MQVLVVDAFGADDPDRSVVDVARAALTGNGHDVSYIALVDDGFTVAMSAEERRAYHEIGANIRTGEVASGTELLGRCQGIVFCYPSLAFTVPAVLKGWLERCMIPGVAFGFDAKGRVKPGLTQVRRLLAITTTPHGRLRRARARDAGRRTLIWSLRLDCSRRCRTKFLALPAGSVGLPARTARRAFRPAGSGSPRSVTDNLADAKRLASIGRHLSRW